MLDRHLYVSSQDPIDLSFLKDVKIVVKAEGFGHIEKVMEAVEALYELTRHLTIQLNILYAVVFILAVTSLYMYYNPRGKSGKVRS